jgi:hypothetical protein
MTNSVGLCASAIRRPSGDCQGMLASLVARARSLRPVCSKNGVVELFRNNLTNCELTSQVRKRRHSGVMTLAVNVAFALIY